MTKEAFNPEKCQPARYDNVIGLPPISYPFTTSEIRSLPCPKKWFFGYGQALQSQPSSKMKFGSVVHACLEYLHLLMMTAERLPNFEDLKTCFQCQGEGCALCDDTGKGAMTFEFDEIEKRIFEQADEDLNWLHDFDFEKFKTTTERTLKGYLIKYSKGVNCLKFRNVVAVEKQMSAPILNPEGGQLITPAKVSRVENHWQFSRPEDEEFEAVDLPVFIVGKCDSIVYDQALGGLWVYEIKTSASPQQFLQGSILDQQVRGYCYILDHVVKAGLLEDVGISKETPVLGYIFDIVHSGGHTLPKKLKSGKYSKDKRSRCPSWLFIETLEKEGQDLQEYSEFIEHLKTTVDPKLYVTEMTPVSKKDLQEFGHELYGKALQVCHSRLKTYQSKTRLQTLANFPKNPVCRGSYCWFNSVCTNDTPETRNLFNQRQPVIWLQPSTNEEKSQCPF